MLTADELYNKAAVFMRRADALADTGDVKEILLAQTAASFLIAFELRRIANVLTDLEAKVDPP